MSSVDLKNISTHKPAAKTEDPQNSSKAEASLEAVLEIVKKHPKVLQFQNSLKFIQGGTNVSLERMGVALELLCADVYLEGMKQGLKQVKEAST